MIKINVLIQAPIQKVWDKWISVDDVENWAFASNEWRSSGIKNEVRVGGECRIKHYAVHGSEEFELAWTYDTVEPQKLLEYTMDDGRKVTVSFAKTDDGTQIIQSFEPESENPDNQQRDGWQAFLDNFKKFVESE